MGQLRPGQTVAGIPGLNTKRLNVDGLLLTGVYASPSAENWTSYVHRHLERVSRVEGWRPGGLGGRVDSQPLL